MLCLSVYAAVQAYQQPQSRQLSTYHDVVGVQIIGLVVIAGEYTRALGCPCHARQVVHRQLIAALEGDRANDLQPGVAARDSAPASPQIPVNSGAAGVLRHAELAEVASRVNVMHRQAKRAQKDCSDLYLLLLLHRCSQRSSGVGVLAFVTAARACLQFSAAMLVLCSPACKPRSCNQLPLCCTSGARFVCSIAVCEWSGLFALS